MNRRELIKQIAFITGSAMVGGEFLLSGCRNTDAVKTGVFTEKDIAFFNEVAETILPETDTPGAKTADAGRFIASYAAGCYDETQIKTLSIGIEQLNAAARNMHRHSFMDCTKEQRHGLLVEVDKEAKQYNEKNKESVPHYFTMMKQLTLFGFFTSKPGATKVLRYMPVPGKYEGCVPYKAGETSWY